MATNLQNIDGKRNWYAGVAVDTLYNCKKFIHKAI